MVQGGIVPVGTDELGMGAAFDDAPVFHTPSERDGNEGQRSPCQQRRSSGEKRQTWERRKGAHVQDTVGFVGQVVKPMRDEDDRLARAHAAEPGQDIALGDGVQRRRRFIDDDESCHAVVYAHECARAAWHVIGQRDVRGDSGLTWRGVASRRLWTRIQPRFWLTR